MAQYSKSNGWNPRAGMKVPTSTGGSLVKRGYPSTTSYGNGGGYTGLSTSVLAQQSQQNQKKGGLTGSRRATKTLSQGVNPYGDYYDKRNGMAQDAYDKSMAALNAAYGAYMDALASNLDSTKGTLLDSYNRSKKNIQDDATQSLKQAYINKMLSEKNFDQQMSAQGISGGASETTRAAMTNNYGNARNNINTTTNRNLSELEGNYNDNLAQAMQAYNQAVAQAQLAKAQQAMEIEAALANNQIAALDDYYALMGDSESQYYGALDQVLANPTPEFTATEATNKVSAPEVIQNDVTKERTYANYLQALKELGIMPNASFDKQGRSASYNSPVAYKYGTIPGRNYTGYGYY